MWPVKKSLASDAVSSVGEAFALTTTANGRACQAELPEPQAEALARKEWDRQGKTCDMAAFLRRLAKVRRTGLACDLDEHMPGL